MIVSGEQYTGSSRFLKRPLAEAGDKVRRSERVLVEINRMQFRKQYVLAIHVETKGRTTR
jgi:hypothetical protein